MTFTDPADRPIYPADADAPALIEEDAPPHGKLTAGEWVRQNLFNSWFNSVLTVVFGALILWVLISLASFVLGADWEIVRRNLALATIGRFPRTDLWRPWTGMFILAATIGLASGTTAAGAADRARDAGLEPETSSLRELFRRFWPVVLFAVVILQFTRTWGPTLLTIGLFATLVAARYLGLWLPAAARRWTWVAVVIGIMMSFRVVDGFGGPSFSVTEVVILAILAGAAAWYRRWGLLVALAVIVVAMKIPLAEGGVGIDEWGGLQLTVFLTVAGITLAFPLGLLLALGRRSNLPAVRWLSITYIEFIRGVPIITLLLVAQFFLGFFLPSGFDPPALVSRALIVLSLFTAAYIAEIVRGGLQSVERGQIEAGLALGLATPAVMRLIVLPQALRAVIPSLVGQFISLFKDTSLVAIIGLTDLLRFSQLANAQGDFVGRNLAPFTLAFVGFVYWVGSYTMSRESRRLERKLRVGEQ